MTFQVSYPNGETYMKVINTFILENYVSQHPEAKNSLLAWLQDVQIREWRNSHEVLNHFPRAISLKGGDEFSFEIQTDCCYLLAAIHYPTKIVSIQAIGALTVVLAPRIHNIYPRSHINGYKTN